MQIGDYVIVRSSPSGCWAGILEETLGTENPFSSVRLSNARRLWRWWAAEGVSLSGVAAAGLHADHLSDCRIAAPVDAIVNEVAEVLAASPVARESIESQPARAS